MGSGKVRRDERYTGVRTEGRGKVTHPSNFGPTSPEPEDGNSGMGWM